MFRETDNGCFPFDSFCPIYEMIQSGDVAVQKRKQVNAVLTSVILENAFTIGPVVRIEQEIQQRFIPVWGSQYFQKAYSKFIQRDKMKMVVNDIKLCFRPFGFP